MARAAERETEKMAHHPWTNRLSRGALMLAVGALLVAGGGVLLARYDLIGKLAGLMAIVLGGGIAALGLVIALIALFLAMRFRTAKRGVLAAMLISAAFVGFLGSRAMVARSVPALHDISTDLADPPGFAVLPLRADNLAGVGTIENWRTVHASAYPDIQSVTIARPVPTVVTDATRLARERGWTIARADAVEGRVEATAAVSFIRFMDDVVIRVRPAPDGNGSIVDMRSVSRVGVSDLGVNAARIREFLTALQAG